MLPRRRRWARRRKTHSAQQPARKVAPEGGVCKGAAVRSCTTARVEDGGTYVWSVMWSPYVWSVCGRPNIHFTYYVYSIGGMEVESQRTTVRSAIWVTYRLQVQGRLTNLHSALISRACDQRTATRSTRGGRHALRRKQREELPLALDHSRAKQLSGGCGRGGGFGATATCSSSRSCGVRPSTFIAAGPDANSKRLQLAQLARVAHVHEVVKPPRACCCVSES